jgi:hypothetical protein
MSNSFYNHGAFPSTGSAATSASMRAELDLVAAGFDKMPTLAGNANKFIVVNSTGTGLTQTDVLPAFTVTDTDFTVQDDGDNTRKFKFNAGSITTGNTRTYVMPDLDTTLVGTNVTQTLTNKTLTAPVIATIVNTGTLTLPTSTDTLVGRNTTDTLTNKTLTNPVIGTIVNTGTLTLPTSTDTLVGRQTTDTLTNKTISGASNTLSNIANGSLSNSSIVIGSTTLSLGGTMTTLAGVTISGASNTLSNIANASLTNSSITINGSTVALGSSVTVTATATNALTIGNGLSGTSYNGSSAVTIAINTGVTADLSTAQTFSNKTISGSANTLTNIANASLTNSAITIGSTAISLGATSLTLAGLTSASATTLISTGNQATSVAISAIGHSSGTVTVTTGTAHGLTTGDTASIDGVADYTFCGVYTVTVTNANVFTYSQTASGASSSGGFSTKLTGTWGLYAGGTGPSLHNGPVIVSASSQMPALRVTQGGSGYALIVEDAANPDTSAFIISNAGDLAINTNKFSVVAASGNTLVAGTLDATGNFNVNTNKFSVVAASGNTTIAGTTSFGGNIVSNLLFTDATYDIGASGATRPRDLFLSRNLVVGGTLTLAGGVNLNGNVTIGDASSDTLTINSTITSNLIFTDNTYDIGASGATRPKNLYLAGLLTMGGALTVAGATNLNGAVTLGDAAADNITVTGTITSNLIFTDNTYDIGASGATRPRSLFLAGGATLAGTLTLNSSTTNDTILINRTTTSTNGIVKFQTASADKWIFGQRNVANDNLYIYSYAGSTDIATFSSTGLAITGALSATGAVSGQNFNGGVSGFSVGGAADSYQTGFQIFGSGGGGSAYKVTTLANNVAVTTVTSAGLAVTGLLNVTNASGTLGTFRQTGATSYGLTIIPGADTTYDALTINNAANTLNQIRMYGDGTATFAGSVGIGTSGPESRLAVKGSSGAADLFSLSDITVPTSGAEFGVAMIKTASTDFMLNLTSYGPTGKGARVYHTGGAATDYAFYVASGGGDRFIVDGRGNLGIAVVPKATWDSGSKALQIGSSGALWERTSDNLLVLTLNSWFDGAADRYIEGGFASRMYQVNGVFNWESAPSGSTDGAISWDTGMALSRAGQLSFTTTQGVAQISNTISASIANGATLDFTNFSGMIIVCNWSTGNVGVFITGGGASTLVSSVGSSYGTVTYPGTFDGYRWTNTTGSTYTFSFTAIRYRPNA